jgi:hypothetical protein
MGVNAQALISAQYGFDGVLLRDGQDTSRMERTHDSRAAISWAWLETNEAQEFT